MASVVIAWELGEAWGHLARCLRLAKALLLRGHSVTLVLKEVNFPLTWRNVAGLRILPAPFIRQHRPQEMPCNYAAVLHCCGFHNVVDMVSRLKYWTDIFYLLKPHVLVADHAPTALLAAASCGIPHMAVGNGFVIPPPQSPWPSIRLKERVSDSSLDEAETIVDDVIVKAQQQLFANVVVDKFRTLFGPQDLLDTFAELDHYGCRSEATYIGPIVALPAALQTQWQYPEQKHVLAYLRPEINGFTTILKALSRLSAEVLCVVPGITASQAAAFVSERFRIAAVPVDIARLLSHADLAVGYGNSGFSTQVLLTGTPLLMCPRHIEQAMFASRVVNMGAGITLSARVGQDQVYDKLCELLDGMSFGCAAERFATKYQAFTTEIAVLRSTNAIEQLTV